ncbi:MAG: T9SS type A sorting domain-containing protein [Flavobacteriales bacterium]|nr:T9SS type A sorting domain-containing protein [Flavobacteriales bacterium]
MLRPAHLFAVLIPVSVLGQSPYPPHLIQDVDWTDGIHNERHSQPVISPGDASLPVSTTGTSTTDFVSGVTVHLTDGFHAGDHSGDGQFHAYIDDGIGSNEDIAIIAPDASHVIDNVLHVEKWEKLEIGLVLPQEYQDAIQRFFEHYYSNGVDQLATTNLIDPIHDLNPYADDSLQVVMTMTKPDESQTLKWGFYMREAKWQSADDIAELTDDTNNPLDIYRLRFRISPDMEGVWRYSIALKAPHISDLSETALPPWDFINFSFVCDPPLPENKGHLSVNEANNRTLKFETHETFLGLGVNMADIRRGTTGYGSGLHQRDFNVMLQTMEEMHDVGGNYMRMYLMRHIFAPEWVNLGVYDAYYAAPPCAVGTAGSYSNTSNCQFHCWAFDKMLEQAHANGIYIQMCVDPYPPGFAFERIIWGQHAYVPNLLEPNRDPVTGRYDLKEFFYTPDDITGERDYEDGAYYYWKRKYKYLMSRWGYSVNIAAIEPFNEVDQMLTYDYHDLTGAGSAVCNENKLVWPIDPLLPSTIDDWLSDIIGFVRGDVVLSNPVSSPLGESKKLFLMSYAWNDPQKQDRETYYTPYYNDAVDLIDAHLYIQSDDADENQPDVGLHGAVNNTHGFLDDFFPDEQNEQVRKPFVIGEFNYDTGVSGIGVDKFFHNYDVSLHNELWASAFSGSFAAGMTWNWERVFGWMDGIPPPPDDDNDILYSINNPNGFTSQLGESNVINIGSTYKSITNRRLNHHFAPLRSLLEHPSWVVYNFFDHDFTTEKAFDNGNDIEAYFLKNVEQNLAIGWVHNRNAWVRNNYFLSSVDQNFLGCVAPGSNSITLAGFAQETQFYVSWFPTRVNSTEHPAQMELESTATGDLILDLTDQFGDIVDNYMDTLRTDFAFIVSPLPFVKSMVQSSYEDAVIEPEWDYSLFPNPTRSELFVRLKNEGANDIALYDISGRLISTWNNVGGGIVQISIGDMAKGSYHVRVTDGNHSKTKKLIIH